MKTVFTSSEIAHVWFHQSAPFGRSPSAMSFDGPLFKSYATGIARLGNHKGKPFVILNDRGFSVTTSAHMSHVRCAIPHGTPLFHLSEDYGASLRASPKDLFAYEMGKAQDRLAYSKRPRVNRAKAEGEAGIHMENANRVAEFFGLKTRANVATVERLAASAERERQKAEKQAKQRAEKARKDAEEDFEAWKRGESVARGSFHVFPVAFRVEGDELVSSKGARVSLKSARVALRFIQSHKGQQWRENGETCPVDSYRIQSISPLGIVAGCHQIEWAEIARVESLLTA